jgi:hypothetical protein
MQIEAVSGWRLAVSQNRARRGVHCRNALTQRRGLLLRLHQPLTAKR